MSSLPQAQSRNQTNALTEKGLDLIRRGYPIIAVKHGSKLPGYTGWTNKPVKNQVDIDSHCSAGRTDVGLLCGQKNGGFYGLDCDTRSKELSDFMWGKVKERFATTPMVRLNNRPKFAIVVRMKGNFSKMQTPIYLDKNRDENKLELLGNGQYLKIYGYNPDTRRDIEWKHGDLAETEPQELLEIDIDDWKYLADVFETKAGELGYTLKTNSKTDTPKSDVSKTELMGADSTGLEHIKNRVGVTVKEAWRDLKHLDPDADVVYWTTVMHALKHEFSGTPQGDKAFRLWWKWSMQGKSWGVINDKRVSDEAFIAHMRQRWDSKQANPTDREPTTYATIKGLVKKSKAARLEAQETKKPFFTMAGDLLANLAPPTWLIKKYIPAEGTGLFFGQSQSGKSFIAVDIACHVAAGLDWHGIRVRERCGVAYVAAEGATGITKRVIGWSQHHDIDMRDLPLGVSNSGVLLPSDVELTIKRLERIPNLGLVILDTYAKTLDGNENSTQDGAAYAMAAEQIRESFNCFVMVVHHVGHVEKDRPRGDSGLTGNYDIQYRIEGTRAGPDLMSSKVVCTKMKDDSLADPVLFSYQKNDVTDLYPEPEDDEDLEAITTLVPVLSEIEDFEDMDSGKTRMTPNKKAVLVSLETAIKSGNGWACSKKDVVRDCAELPEFCRAKRPDKSINYAIDALISDGYITNTGGYLYHNDIYNGEFD
jgi:hypothetical protein